MPAGAINTIQAAEPCSVVTSDRAHHVHIGDMRYLTIMRHNLSHLSEMLVEYESPSTTLRLTAGMVLIALRALRLSEATTL